MLIIGAKGFAKEVLEICFQNNAIENLAFYDDINEEIGSTLFQQFPILNSIEQAKKYFEKTDNRFTIGIGNPHLRSQLFEKFTSLGGEVCTLISPFARIGNYGNSMGEGCIILTASILTNDILLGKCVLINLSCTIGHDVRIGDFVEVCPGVNISGNCKIGNFTFIGTNSTILPGIKIGENVVIGAGSVVTKDIPDNCTAVGIPARVIKQ